MPDRVNAAGYSIFTGRAGGGRQVLPKRFTACVETSGSCEYTLLPPSISRVFLSVKEAKFSLGAVVVVVVVVVVVSLRWVHLAKLSLTTKALPAPLGIFRLSCRLAHSD